ncbi:MAG: lysophospholipid acyltransferase family protein [Victivallales bacterium]|nr:lysophospholipid acyltransferase family protein [Victivallales bacterium]
MPGRIKHYLRQFKKPPAWIFLPAVLLVRFMRLFMRLDIHDPNNCMDVKTYPYITVTWHNRLLFFPTLFPRWAREKSAAMISASRDGQYLASIVGYFGIRTVRGSTSRKGAAALRESIAMLKEGTNVCITPDGPRGPRYVMSKGPVILASMTGIPVVPLGINYSSFWELKSWDRFQIPRPWSRIKMVIGDPLRIPPNITDEELEGWRLLLEERLNSASRVGE